MAIVQKMFFVTCSILLLVINVMLMRSSNVLGETTEIDAANQIQHEDLTKQYDYWAHTVSAYPNYRDGYYSLAILSYERNNIQLARNYLARVESLDPNFAGIAKLRRLLMK